MRLRLIIRRNGLPDAHILWNSTGLHNASSSHNTTRTIADFLHEVDDVIPLESEDWGMENYVVEVGGFECVHFSVLDNILKEDDEVVIRPLSTNDSRFRRVSGRVQVSADGRRLYDGIAFGRPFVRKAPRPPVRIPWQKIARLTNDEEDPVQLGSSNQLVLQDESSDAEDDDEDSDYNEEMSAEEIADLAAESVAYDHQDISITSSPSRKRKRTGLGIQALDHETPRITSLSSNSTWRQGHGSVRRATRESPKSVRFEEEGADTPVTILAVDSSRDSHDDATDSSRNGSVLVNREANKENIAPGKLVVNRVASQASRDTDESSADSIDTTSSSGSGSNSDLSDTESTSPFGSSEESSSSDESESISTSESITPTKPTRTIASTIEAQKQIVLDHGPTEEAEPTRRQVSPGQGKRVTKKRNARRKLKRRFDRVNSLGLPVALDDGPGEAVSDKPQADFSHELSTSIGVQSLEQRKAALLQNLALQSTDPLKEGPAVSQPEGAKVDPVSNDDDSRVVHQHDTLESSSQPLEVSSKVDTSIIQNSHENESIEHDQRSGVDHDTMVVVSEAAPEPKQTPRRTKLDMGSAKRMLFGSLGLRAPKSKGDADKLREDLKQKAQQLPGNALGSTKTKEKSPVPTPQSKVQDDDSWRDRIDLQAVECCYDGVEYSKPPFPFIQRWDPQQQYQISGQRKRGRDKRKDRDNKKYYQDSYQVEGYLGNSYNQQEADHDNPNEESGFPDYGNEIEQNNSDTYAANDQLLGEMQAETSAIETVDDLPRLPDDMSTLKQLTQDMALPGCIIAFKQMEMSEQTQWSPVISDYRTAKIETILENGTLEVLLAARDIPQKEKNYDPKTGQRIYAKFDMPVEEEGEEDESRLEIALQDMIEPKLVQAAADQVSPASFSSTIKTAVNAVQDVLAVGKEIVTTILPSISQKENLAELDGATVELELETIKLEKSGKPDQTLQGPATTFRTESTFVASQESQAAIPGDDNLSRWRDASIELGSQLPSQRFFSEAGGGLISEQIDETMHSATENDNDPYAPISDKGLTASRSGLEHDDPSIWANRTENNDDDESTRFYSIPEGQDNNIFSSNPGHGPTAKNIVADADTSSDLEDSVIVHSSKRNLAPATATQVLEEVEHSLFVDDDPMEVQPLDQSGDSSEYESEDDTFVQESMGQVHPNSKIESTARPEDADSDPPSSSLPSLKDLLSQPIIRPPEVSRAKNQKTKTSTYPQIPSATPEDAEAFVFSQAPKRIISRNEKMLADLETESFLGSSDVESTNEPYELEANSLSGVVTKTEDDKIQLPSILISRGSDNTPRNSTTSGMVVDLTLSSDPVDSNDVSTARTISTGSSMPSGPGWIDKPARASKSKTKPYGKSPRSSLRRKKSLV